ncbi:hypothetical protein AWB95_21150 [Mycobacterium celatum]|uniref:Uncharacterized protein n=2 Tax=Mycobacterium celatum TaxID=28045 RepID=A0A1X1RK39_MYCCE|nr:hypothetical protein AWB95_21150 [Mycobacterium celatum]PIB75324.1 hypothetical protein CQY23_20175 [Mycobacterium celatum]
MEGAMSDSKVKFTVTVHDVDLATWAKVEDVSEAEAAEEFAIVASERVADALHAQFDNITISTTREDGSLLFTERPGDFPD